MANLESAAMLALQSGVDPYSSKSYLDWMSSVPESQKQLPGAIKRQRDRQVSELESGIPEKIRTAAQPLARRGLHGSGLQLEDVGQAALDRQIAIDRAKTLAEIDPIQAQIALQDLTRERAVQRGGEERRRFEREEDVTERQRAQDQLMKAALAKAGIGILAGTNPLSSAIFGGKGQEGLLQKAIGGVGSLFGGGTVSDTSLGDPGLGLQSEYGLQADTSKLNIDPVTGRVSPLSPPPLFGTGMDAGSMQMPSSYYDPDTSNVRSPYASGDDEFAMAGTVGGYTPNTNMMGTVSPDVFPGTDTNVQRTNFGDITPYEGEAQFPMPDTVSEADRYMMEQGEGGGMYGGTSPFGTGMIESDMTMPIDQVQQMGTEFTPFAQTTPSPSTFSYAPTPSGVSPPPYLETGLRTFTPAPTIINPDISAQGWGTPAPTYSGFETEVTPFLNRTLNPDVYDVDFDNFLGPDLFEEDYFDFSKASGTPSTDVSEATRKAMEQGFQAAEGKTFANPLDDPNLTAMLGTDALMKNTPVTEGETDILGTLGSVAKLPFQALDAGMKAVGGAKKAVSDLTTKALDTATGGAYSGITSGIKGLGGQATKAVSEALGGVVSPSTVGSLALTAATGGLKNIAKNPMQFAGQKILASSLPSLKTTVGALAKGTLPDIAWTADAALKAATTSAAGQAAGTAAYNAAIAKGATIKAATTAKTAATAATAAPSFIGAATVAIPMILASIGSMEKKKSRAKAEAEEMRNLSGSSPFNFVPGGLWGVGNKRRSPALDEASGHFTVTDQLTGLGKIYLEDPRRSVMGGDSLSKRGQDFGREAGVDYKHSDPDVQNTSQKWLGKQQVYSELIPDLKPIFMAGLRGEMSREQTEDEVSKYTNKFFEENPAIRQIHTINKRIKDIEHREADEIDTVQDQIMALKEQAKQLYQKVPLAWKKAPGLTTQVISLEEILEKAKFIEDEQE